MTSMRPENKQNRQLQRLLMMNNDYQSRLQKRPASMGRLGMKHRRDLVAGKLTQMLKSVFKIPQELYFDTPELVRSRGYAVETHHVTTHDGYILVLHHLLGPLNSSPSEVQKPDVALLMSSIFGSSSDFVINEPHESLGYILADSGYDVWLGNFRGSRSGLNHTHLNADTDRFFWNFSMDEIAQYDYPALINSVLEHTGQQKLFFFSYSASTLPFFMAGSPTAGIMDKVRMSVAFAPIAYVKQPSVYVKTMARLMLTIQVSVLTIMQVCSPVHSHHPNFSSSLTLALQGTAEKVLGGPLYRGSDLLSSLLFTVCSDGSPFWQLCLFVATTAMGGTNKGYFRKNGFSLMLASATSGVSVRSVAHLAQQPFAPGIQMYDYGSEAANRVRYGSLVPPLYNLSDVTAPVVICTAPNDSLMSEEDLQRMMRDLPDLVTRIVPFQRDFGHFDLLFAKNAKELIYNQLIEIMKQY
ncbi:AB-hydrolase lipase domain [Trinorchestia longiramus]|nr:AB-hydrolase lipase domain [Trinorchestia longiramus]